MKYRIDNDCRGHSVFETGRFPLVKDRETINRRLDGKIVHGHEREYCTILTAEEENYIVEFAKNKNGYHHGLNKKKLQRLILDVLNLLLFTLYFLVKRSLLIS